MSERSLCYAWLAGSIAIVLGVFLPWYHVTAPLMGTLTRTGAETQGLLLPLLGITTGACAYFHFLGLGRAWSLWAGAAAAAGAALLATVGLVAVAQALAHFSTQSGANDAFAQAISDLVSAGFEPGILLCWTGSAAATVAPATLALARGR